MSVIPKGGTGAEQLTQFIERIERLEEEKRALMADIKDVYAEAKATGFEPKIMRQVVRLRAMDHDLLSDQDALLDTYRDALEAQLFLSRLSQEADMNAGPRSLD